MTTDPHWRKQLLTVALEDYYQVGAFNALIQRKQWYRFESRIEKNTFKTLDLLDRNGIKATFFILGWIADQYPELVREVAKRGHEIASKGYYHRSIGQMTPAEFLDDAKVSKQALEEASGQRVFGYRVAHDWFQPQDLWALDALAEAGYAYDSSIAPIGRQYREESWRRFPHQHTHQDKTLWEFPITTARIAGMNVPISGGNYFRQLPQWFLRNQLNKHLKKQQVPGVFYFHVWEIDPDQPRITAGGRLGRIRHYRNLDRMEEILQSYFKLYQFTTVADYLKLDLAAAPEPAAVQPANSLVQRLRDRTSAEIVRSIQPEANKSEGRTAATIVVPLYNEELVLPYLANTLSSVYERLSGEYELQFVLVDDGSKDRTWQEMRRLFGNLPGFDLVKHEANRGVAAAVLTGIRKARNEIVCSIDCDCSYDPHELARMIPLLKPGVDLVTASPYHPEGSVRNVPGWRLKLSKTASGMYRRVLRQNLYTYTSCFRVHRRSKFVDMKPKYDGYLGVAEMLGLLDVSGGKIVEFPTVLEVRMLGRSKMKTLRTIMGHLKLMGRLARLRMTTTPGTKEETPPSDPSKRINARLRELQVEAVREEVTV